MVEIMIFIKIKNFPEIKIEKKKIKNCRTMV